MADSTWTITLQGGLSADDWIRIEGGALPRPVEIKLRVTGPDQPIIIGLRLDDGSAITSRDLRGIRLPELARAVLNEVREIALSLEESAEDGRRRLIEVYGHNERSARTVDPFVPGWSDEHAAATQWAENGAAAMELRSWLEAVSDAQGELETKPRGRGSLAPSIDELREFARIYLEELLDGPSAVVPRTARRTHMSRPTAYRWLSACREAGLIPVEESR